MLILLKETMARLPILSLIVAILVVGGCDDPQRSARLQKENAELKAQLNEKNVTRNYDLQTRCSKDARAWFNQNYSRDKDTIMLDFSNHYNSASNQCLIFVEEHSSYRNGRAWLNNMSLYNVYENAKYGNYLEEHVYGLDHDDPKDAVITCEMFDQKCTSLDQFNKFAQPYMNN
jgi:hypothetical protein